MRGSFRSYRQTAILSLAMLRGRPHNRGDCCLRCPFRGFRLTAEHPDSCLLRTSPMAESTQHKLDRVRRPRVQISYDVETGGAMQKTELPLVVGVLADLSAQRKDPLPVMKERKFSMIDRDNFNDVLSKAAPRLAMKVDN